MIHVHLLTCAQHHIAVFRYLISQVHQLLNSPHLHLSLETSIQSISTSFMTIAEAGLEFLESLKHTKEVSERIEKATREQSLSGRWFKECQLRLIVSKFGIIVKRNRHTSLVSQLLYKYQCFSISIAVGKRA